MIVLTHDTKAPDGWRTATITANKLTFGATHCQTFDINLAYPSDMILNIVPPTPYATPAGYCKSVWDAIGSIQSEPENQVPLPEGSWDRYIIENLNYGITVQEFARMRKVDIPDTCWHYRRVSYKLPIMCNCSEHVLLHPMLPRALSITELSRCMEMPLLQTWLDELHVLMVDGWSKDYESHWNDKTQTWEGSYTPGKQHKTMSLSSYHYPIMPGNLFPPGLSNRKFERYYVR